MVVDCVGRYSASRRGFAAPIRVSAEAVWRSVVSDRAVGSVVPVAQCVRQVLGTCLLPRGVYLIATQAVPWKDRHLQGIVCLIFEGSVVTNGGVVVYAQRSIGQGFSQLSVIGCLRQCKKWGVQAL